MTISISTHARITRGIFNAVTAWLIPAVVRLHHKSLTRIQDQQDQALADARQAQYAAHAAALDADEHAYFVASTRTNVLIALAEERRRIDAYVKEDCAMSCDCNNPAQCWEPCGSLGHDPDHAVLSRYGNPHIGQPAASASSCQLI